MNYRFCKRITAAVILPSFWKMPLFGEQPMTRPPNSSESGMRLCSEYEVDTLIEDLTAAAEEAIEKTAQVRPDLAGGYKNPAGVQYQKRRLCH